MAYVNNPVARAQPGSRAPPAPVAQQALSGASGRPPPPMAPSERRHRLLDFLLSAREAWALQDASGRRRSSVRRPAELDVPARLRQASTRVSTKRGADRAPDGRGPAGGGAASAGRAPRDSELLSPEEVEAEAEALLLGGGRLRSSTHLSDARSLRNFDDPEAASELYRAASAAGKHLRSASDVGVVTVDPAEYRRRMQKLRASVKSMLAHEDDGGDSDGSEGDGGDTETYSFWAITGRLWPMLRLYLPWLLLLLTTSALMAVARAALPELYANLYDALAEQTAIAAAGGGEVDKALRKAVWHAARRAGVVLLVLLGVTVADVAIDSHVGVALDHHLTRAISASLLTKRYEFFTRAGSTPAALQALVGGGGQLAGLYVTALPSLLTALIKLGIGLVRCLMISPWFLLVAVAIKPLQLTLAFVSFAAMRSLSSVGVDLNVAASEVLGDALGNIRALLALGGQEHAQDAYVRAVAPAEQLAARVMRRSSAYTGAAQGLLVGQEMLCVWFGVTQVLDRHVSIGELIALGFYVIMISQAAEQAFKVSLGIPEELRKARRVLALLLRTEDDEDVQSAPRTALSLRGYRRLSPHEEARRRSRSTLQTQFKLSEGARLELRSVRFAYPDALDAPALRGLSVVLSTGSRTALLGDKGAGRSTLLGLALRLYDPTSGQVLLDGSRSVDVCPAAWRQRVSLVAHEPVLFSRSVFYNIAVGCGDPTDNSLVARAVSAARAASAHDLIAALPNGYDTMVGARGMSLPPEHAQRIALARLIMRQPAVVLLDEVAPTVDAQAEREWVETVARHLPKATLVTVARHFEAVGARDRVVVMHNGRVLEEGVFEELAGDESSGLSGLIARRRAGNNPTET